MHTRELTCLSSFFLLLLNFTEIIESIVSLPACDNSSNLLQNITIPGNPLPATIIYTNISLKCLQVETRGFLVSNPDPLFPRNFRDFQGISDTPRQSFFTAAGFFYDNVTETYYNPDRDFCIQSFSNEEIIVRLCPVGPQCSNSICIPKCCPADEVLVFWKRKCMRVPGTGGITPWRPPVFSDYWSTCPSPKINFVYSKIPETCNAYKLPSGNYSAPYLRQYVGAFVQHPKYPDTFYPEDNIKLLSTSGHGPVQLLSLYVSSRKWKVNPVRDFCVDGFYVNNANSEYAGEPQNFVVYYCHPAPSPQNDEPNPIPSFVYISTSILSLIFLSSTVLVYLLLWDKHNLHGLTILSYSLSSLLSYASLTVSHIISILPDPSWTGIFERGPFCYGVSVTTHYFYVSTYLWLTTMNFDLWLTFNQVRAVKRNSREATKFMSYSAFAWGLPAVIVGLFVAIDEIYRDPKTLVKVPDYAIDSCWVATEFRGIYVFLPMGIILTVNMTLLGMTMGIFLRARRESSRNFSGGLFYGSRYTMKLFAKLFVIMGGTSIVDFLTWYYDTQKRKPGLVVFIECLAYSTPILLFILFCCNERIANQLQEKYPKFSERVYPLLTFFTKTKSRPDESTGSTGRTSRMNFASKTEAFSLKQSISI